MKEAFCNPTVKRIILEAVLASVFDILYTSAKWNICRGLTTNVRFTLV